GVKTARTAAFGGLGGLAVDHPGRWASLTSGPFAGLLQQQEIDGLPKPLPPAKRRSSAAPSSGSENRPADTAALPPPPEAAPVAASRAASPPANAARSAPIPRRSCHLHSANLLADTAAEWFQSTCCFPREL